MKYILEYHGPVSVANAPDFRLQQNNFDLLRFLLAFLVFLVHAYVLSGARELSILGDFLSSEIAVKSFFVVSGFLIFMSYENSSDLRGYFVKRARRIYPAYFFVIMTCAVLGGVFSTCLGENYFSEKFLKYLVVNLVFLNFLQPTLPGLFTGNLFQAVDGALWTLKVEVMFYFFVPLAVMAFRRFGRLSVMVALYIFSVTYSVLMSTLADKTGASLYLELQRQLPGQLAFFVAGGVGYYYFHFFKKYATLLLALAGAAFALQGWLYWVAIQPLALGVLVVYFSCVAPRLGNFGKYGDFSYGIYIVHFPILQLLISYDLFRESPWAMLFIACLLVITVAFLLWHLIEKHFLRKSSYCVAVPQG